MDVAESLNAVLRRVPTWAAYGLGLVPLGVLVWQAGSGALGIDPVKMLERQLGLTALQLLLAGLLVTPLRRWAGVNLIRFRRVIGLLAFLYAALHLLVWVLLDLQLLLDLSHRLRRDHRIVWQLEHFAFLLRQPHFAGLEHRCHHLGAADMRW